MSEVPIDDSGGRYLVEGLPVTVGRAIQLHGGDVRVDGGSQVDKLGKDPFHDVASLPVTPQLSGLDLAEFLQVVDQQSDLMESSPDRGRIE